MRKYTLVPAAMCLWLVPGASHAWSIGYQLDSDGCHEPITAEALRNVRRTLATAPPLEPTRDEAALIDDVQFRPPSDFHRDLAGMTLLLGVRDNDVKGQNLLASLNVTEVHGNPMNQEEHCIRASQDDGPQGEQAAMAACRDYIRRVATEALDGLDAAGMVDPDVRIPLEVYLSVRGQVSPPLPLFYVKMGQALHALEDGFTHTYRSADGLKVTVVLNWIDWVEGNFDEARDGPPHLSSLDHCGNTDPIIVRNVRLATQAATELLTAALDPALTRDQKVARFDAITAAYLSFQEGCTIDNNWCEAPEPKVADMSGCGCGVDGRRVGPWLGAVMLALILRRRRRLRTLALVAPLLGALVAPAYAQQPPPPVNAPADSAQQPKEPGRDVKTPTTTEIEKVREDKRLGPRFGFAVSLGGSWDRPAAVGRVGMRYRIDERWLLGLDGEWNPWITTAPVRMRSGSLNFSAVGILRFPMKYDRVNLRSTLRLGVSTLLFDVYGAPKYKTGPFVGASLLGIDFDLGNSLRIVIDPAELSVPIPVVGPLPLYYEQVRFMVGLQYGS